MIINKARGFTLLEALIATVILTVGVVALMWAFNTGIFATTDIENVELAVGIAQAKLENIYSTTGGVSDESRHDVSNDGFTGSIYANKNFQTEVITDDNDPEKVTVNVYWNTKGGETSVALKTLVKQ
jgi:Tfp pilus assembly protein PilV